MRIYLIFLVNLLFSTFLSAQVKLEANVLDYIGTPKTSTDRTGLAFSDKGAWFAYGLAVSDKQLDGFSGPFLMSDKNGTWLSQNFNQLAINVNGEQQRFQSQTASYASHLAVSSSNDLLSVKEVLFFKTAEVAVHQIILENQTDSLLDVDLHQHGSLLDSTYRLEQNGAGVIVRDKWEQPVFYAGVMNQGIANVTASALSYAFEFGRFQLKKGEKRSFLVVNALFMDGFDAKLNHLLNQETWKNANESLAEINNQKVAEVEQLFESLPQKFQNEIGIRIIQKVQLTLQNNWRIPAGEIKHSGLFPSYHYKWFHGMWAWDSWKHAAALAHYKPDLAKDQIRVMYDYQMENGYIPDCIFRDTTIEKHNYRDTKPPLSAWAVWQVFEQDKDTTFIIEMYPKIIRQHNWWYSYRDHDRDGICEYGSADGTLVAAKWESGMDNAVRFDNSEILENEKGGYSLNQESVDLNAYLYAEKLFLAKMAAVLGEKQDFLKFDAAAIKLKKKIQKQFFDAKSGWFYDTDLKGKNFITAKGCEGWIPLWANIATEKQAMAVKDNMMDSTQFFGKLPFQTLAANHPNFKPNNGYWRGPVWLDQAYFGVMALRNYGYNAAADSAAFRLLKNAQGLLDKGPSIRENYQPLTGAGLEAENFSWSAAHYLLLILEK